jgi:hypothetical protein
MTNQMQFNQVIASPLIFIPAQRGMELPPPTSARIIRPEQGRALEMLAHAIEYLEDEIVMPAPKSVAGSELITSCESIERLRTLQRSLWYSLPLRVPFWRRLFQWHTGPAQVITLPSA